MFRTLLLAGVLAASSTPALTQDPQLKPAKPSTREAALWLEDAKVLTAEMLDDQLTLDYAPYRYLLHGRLAEAWWKADNRLARQHLATAETVVRERITETPLETLRRLHVALLLARVVVAFDPAEGDRMLDSILDQAAKAGPQAKSIEEMNAKSLFALEISAGSYEYDGSPARQVKQFRAVVGLDAGDQVPPMLLNIYLRDNSLGDKLYGETLDAIANHTLSSDTLGGLVSLSFPQTPRSPNYPIKVSPQLGERLLSLARDEIVQKQEAGLTRDSCNELIFMFRLIPHMPATAQAEVTPAATQCKSLVQSQTQAKRLDDFVTNKPPATADYYLQISENATTVRERAGYKRLAISILSNQDPEKALELIDGLTAEERDAMPGIDLTRYHIEMRLVPILYKAKDYTGLQSLISRSPRPPKIALLIANSAKDDPSYALSLLPVIVDKLGDGKVDDSAFYIDVLAYVSKYAPPMLPIVFRDAVKGLNQVTEFIPGLMKFPERKKDTMVNTPFWFKMDPAMLPPMFDVLDVRSTRLLIDTVKFPVARQSLRLWLLKNELKEYEDARKTRPTS